MIKRLMFLTLLSICSTLFAINQEILPIHESIPVSFAGAKDSFECGFSVNSISRISQNPIVPSVENSDNTQNEKAVEFTLSGKEGSRDTREFFLWWKVYTKAAITIQIKEATPLSNGNTFIHWTSKIKTGDVEASPLTSTSTNTKPYIVKRLGQITETKGYPRAGSVPIELEIPASEIENKNFQNTESFFTGTITIEILSDN